MLASLHETPAARSNQFLPLPTESSLVTLQLESALSQSSKNVAILARFPAQSFRVSAPNIIGHERFSVTATNAVGPERYLAKITNAICVGQSRIVIPAPFNIAFHDEYFHQDELVSLKSHTPVSNGCISLPITRPQRAVPKAIHLMQERDFNYFHWTVEVLPRAFLLRRQQRRLPVLISSGLHRNLRELLRLVLPDSEVIEVNPGETIFVEKLFFTSDVARCLDVLERPVRPDDHVIQSSEILSMRELVLSKIGNPAVSTKKRRLYFKRGKNRRSAQNENEVIALLRRYGFEIIDPESLSLREQIELWRSPEIVIAPAGAVLTNMIWSDPGSYVVALNSDFNALDPYIMQHLAELRSTKLVQIFGQRCFRLTGRDAFHDDYLVDLDCILKLLNDVLPG